jgi:hypothetical protein
VVSVLAVALRKLNFHGKEIGKENSTRSTKKLVVDHWNKV